MNAKPPLLQAFRQPWVLLSILILLLNDHVLKSSVPSWLTGKLSDFAGLFFFPFLLGVIIQGAVWLVWRGKARQPKASTILLAAMLASAVFFAMVKLIPAVNGAASATLTRLFGLPAPIALDPSDLIALLVLVPAWRLWQSLEQPAVPVAPGKLAYAALALGAAASLASVSDYYRVQRVVVEKSTLYAYITEDTYTWLGGGYAVSTDYGKSWSGVFAPLTKIQALTTPVALPKTLCDPVNSQTCYRITGKEQVDESQDGGQTWNIAWQIPPGRESYMTRAAFDGDHIGGKTKPDFSPYDMVFLPGGGPSTLMVAMGNEGFLLHTSGQAWQRSPMTFVGPEQSSHSPTPTRFQAASISEALADIWLEWLLALVVGVLVFLAFGLWSAIYAVRQQTPAAGRGWRWVFAPALWLCAWLVFREVIWAVLNLDIFPYRLTSFLWQLVTNGALSIVPFVLIACAIIWYRAGKITAHPARFYSLAISVLLLTGLVALSTLPSFVLWALGWIVSYELALEIAAVLSLSLLVAGVILYRHLLHRLTA